MSKPTVYYVGTQWSLYYHAIKIAVALASSYHKIHGKIEQDPINAYKAHLLDKEGNTYLTIEIEESPSKSDMAYAG